MAILWGWPGLRGVEGKRRRDLDAGRHWRDGACVVGMRGKQRGGRRAVCSFSMWGHGARLWTERIRNDEDKGMLGSQKREGGDQV